MDSDNSQALNEILLGREKRAEMQRELIKAFGTTLISFSLNIPGIVKNSSLFTKVHDYGIKKLEEDLDRYKLNVVYKTINNSPAGNVAYFCVDEDAINIKKICVDLEERNEIGRLFDFDVFDRIGKQLTRKQMGLNERKCLLCEEKAIICSRSKKHSIDELTSRVFDLIYRNNLIKVHK